MSGKGRESNPGQCVRTLFNSVHLEIGQTVQIIDKVNIKEWQH